MVLVAIYATILIEEQNMNVVLLIVDVIVILGLIGLPVCIDWCKRNLTNNGGQPIVKKSSYVLSSLSGIVLGLYYYLFRYHSSPWSSYNMLHLAVMPLGFIMPFALAHMTKGTSLHRKVAIILGSIIILSPLTRPFFVPIASNLHLGDPIGDWYKVIPLNLCNISALIYLPAIIFKNKVGHMYMCTFGVLGGILNIVYPVNNSASF
jgi:hypothetical protein